MKNKEIRRKLEDLKQITLTKMTAFTVHASFPLFFQTEQADMISSHWFDIILAFSFKLIGRMASRS